MSMLNFTLKCDTTRVAFTSKHKSRPLCKALYYNAPPPPCIASHSLYASRPISSRSESI